MLGPVELFDPRRSTHGERAYRALRPGPVSPGFPEHRGFQFAHNLGIVDGYPRPLGVLEDQLHAGGFVLAVDLALRVGVVGADLTQFGHLIQDVHGAQTGGLYSLLGGAPDRPGDHVFGHA